MSRIIVPILFFIVSVGLFFTYIDPAYKKMQEIQALDARLDSALTKSREFQEARDALLARYEAFNIDDINRLQVLLPDSIDNVSLTLGVDTIAKTHNIELSEFDFREEVVSSSVGGQGAVGSPYRAVLLSFAATGSYADFVNFLRDLEKSLRIVDTHRIAVSASRTDARNAPDDSYFYEVTLKSYWLQ